MARLRGHYVISVSEADMTRSEVRRKGNQSNEDKGFQRIHPTGSTDRRTVENGQPRKSFKWGQYPNNPAGSSRRRKEALTVWKRAWSFWAAIDSSGSQND